MAFISSGWWDLAAVTALGFNARLLEVDGKKVAGNIVISAQMAL
jgi:DNA topoisomerase I